MRSIHEQVLTHEECLDLGLPFAVRELPCERRIRGPCQMWCSDEIHPPDVELRPSQNTPELWVCHDCWLEEGEGDSDSDE